MRTDTSQVIAATRSSSRTLLCYEAGAELTGNQLAATDNLFCGGHILLSNNNILVIGGDDLDSDATGAFNGLASGLNLVRIFNTAVSPPTYSTVATMSAGRWCAELLSRTPVHAALSGLAAAASLLAWRAGIQVSK